MSTFIQLQNSESKTLRENDHQLSIVCEDEEEYKLEISVDEQPVKREKLAREMTVQEFEEELNRITGKV